VNASAASSATSNRRPRVVYGNDPLCGWCFAIGPELIEAKRRTTDRFDWHVECGGLVVGDRVHPVAQDREYLVAGLAQVAAVSGRQASAAYFDGLLADGTWVSNSEPSCRAVIVVRELAPDRVIEFSHGLTDALYLDGREPDAPDTIRDIADGVGVDGDLVVTRWSAPAARDATVAAFAHARAIGVTTYPSLFVDVGGGLAPIVAGWSPADAIVAALENAAEPLV
jgi:putative protein-disulfide isomerase